MEYYSLKENNALCDIYRLRNNISERKNIILRKYICTQTG